MARASPSVIRVPEELEGECLARALGTGPVASFAVEPIGTGQMSQTYRISLAYEDEDRAGPDTVVMKVAAADSTSRATGVGMGIYEREIRFYQELAPRIGGPLASCHLAVYDEREGWFTLLLEDVSPAAQGDQIAGCSVDQARLAMCELARAHAPVLGDPALAVTPWLNQPSPVSQAVVSQLLPAFLERYGERIAPDHRALCERLVASLDGWLGDRRSPLGLVHGDFRLDNLLFGQDGSSKPLTVVDWQTVSWGGAMADAAYFLGGSLGVEDRRAHEEGLFREYHESLRGHGVRDLVFEQCWEQYRRHTFSGVLMAIVAPMVVERTERGDDMFMTMIARHAQHALDLDATELLFPAGARRPAPVRPEPDDEERHEPGNEELWNESWYFDAVSGDAGLGIYVRIGLYPNLGTCWYTAFVCRPGAPAVAVVDFAAPLPEGPGMRTETDGLRADHLCQAALQRFRVVLEATGEAHEDHAAPLRGEPGRQTPVAVDLVWETDGEPYAYRVTTRYEIPCLVSGTVRVGDEDFELHEAVGQRDHSWGPRDWWSMDWVWSAGRLDDGTRFHAVELRMASAPSFGVGYVLSPGGELTELDGVAAVERVADDGLIKDGRLSLHPPGLEIELEPLAFGPLRLVAPDGRVSHFPRAMCRLRTGDGRSGLGWVEWNRNQPGVYTG
jgi:phosphotransferase family enzyme